MKTRSQRVKLEKDGIPPSPPHQLPETRRPTRVARSVGTKTNTRAPTGQVANTRAPRRSNKKASNGKQQTHIFQDADIPQQDVVGVTCEKLASSSPSHVHLRSAPPSPHISPPQVLARPPFAELGPLALNVFPRAQSPNVPDAPIAVPDAPVAAPSPMRGPSVPHSLIHVWVDPAWGDLASHGPSADSDVAMAIPSSFVPELLQMISACLATKPKPELTSVIASQVSLSPKAPRSSNKRKLLDDTDMSRPTQRARLDLPTPSRILKKKGTFSRKPFEPISKSPNPAIHLSPPTPSDNNVQTTNKQNVSQCAGNGRKEKVSDQVQEPLLFPIPPQPISLPQNDRDDKKETAPTSSSEHSDSEGEISGRGRQEHRIVVQSRVQAESVPEPENPGVIPWGFNSLLNSARSVSKYLPRFTSRQTLEAENVRVLEVGVSAPNPNANSTPPQIQHHQNSAQTEPRERTRSVAFTGVPSTADTVQNQRQKKRKSSPRRLKSKADIQASRNRKAERTSRQAQEASVMEEKGRAAKESQARENAEIATKTGGKRKRSLSPESIPNPPGTSFGMDLDYFGWLSSDEFDDEVTDKDETTPTKARPNKSRRLNNSEDRTELLGDPKKARPYTGAFFSDTSPTYQGGNVFEELSSAEKARAKAEAQKAAHESLYNAPMRQARKMQKEREMREAKEKQEAIEMQKIVDDSRIRITNLTGSFRVPDPSDSDSDPENSPEGSVGRRSPLSETSAVKGGARRGMSKELLTSPTAKSSPQRQNSKATVVSPKNKDASKPTTITGANESPKKVGARSQTPKRATTSSVTRRVLESTLKGNSTLQHNDVPSDMKTATPQAKAPETWKQPPPPRPTPSHAALPSVTSTDSDALAIVRKRALRHQPLKPSGLRESSRLSSPMAASHAGDDLSSKDITVDSQKNPVAEGDSKARADHQNTSSTSSGQNIYNPKKPIFAGNWPIKINSYEEYRENIDPKVAALLDATKVDSGAFGSIISNGFAGPNAKSPDKTRALKPVSSPSARNPKIKRPSYTIDPKVTDYINSNWTERDEQHAAETFKSLYSKWLAENEE